MEKQATIRDVARLAGVSLATVSRVLSDGDYPVSAELKQRVRDAVAQLGYVPNTVARSLRQDVSRDIGLVIPNISNPFYLQTMLGINDALNKKDYSLILCNTMRNAQQERVYLRQLFERKVRGIILSSVDENADIVKEYGKKGMKFVLLDQKITGMESTGINFDSRAGARMATEHLISLGHSRIAFATMPMTRWTRTEMHMGYRDALVLAGLGYDSRLVYERMPEKLAAYADFELEAGKMIAESFLADGCPATAIVCINDMLAIGLIKTLKARGVRVPEDVSVFGFDDIPFASTFEPSLSTVHYPAIETGRLAAMMLMDTLESGSGEMPVSMQLAPSLVIRETVAPPSKK
jgi:LacI family transcriptional regulator